MSVGSCDSTAEIQPFDVPHQKMFARVSNVPRIEYDTKTKLWRSVLADQIASDEGEKLLKTRMHVGEELHTDNELDETHQAKFDQICQNRGEPLTDVEKETIRAGLLHDQND